MSIRNFRKFTFFLFLSLTIAFASPVFAQSLGPDFNVIFNPDGSATVGQDVNIHIKVDSANPGAAKISVACGGVSKTESSEVEFDSTWHTGNCFPGTINISICTKAADDPSWKNPNCRNFIYRLSAAGSAQPGLTPTLQTVVPDQGGAANYPGTDGNCGGEWDQAAGAYNQYECQVRGSDYVWSKPDKNSQVVGLVTFTSIQDYENSEPGKRIAACNQGYTWEYIQKDGISGWIVWGSKADLSDCPIPNIPETSAQPQTPIQTVNVAPTDVPLPLDGYSDNDPACGLGLCAYASVNTSCSPQCVKTARQNRDDLVIWAGVSTSDQILAIAQTQPTFSYQGQQYQVRVRNQGEQPQAGDLVIWPSKCDGAWSGGGHIGYVTSGSPFRISDSNWGTPNGSTCATRNDQPISVKSCMRFITKPFLPGSIQSSPANSCNQYAWWDPRGWWCNLTNH